MCAGGITYDELSLHNGPHSRQGRRRAGKSRVRPPRGGGLHPSAADGGNTLAVKGDAGTAIPNA